MIPFNNKKKAGGAKKKATSEYWLKAQHSIVIH